MDDPDPLSPRYETRRRLTTPAIGLALGDGIDVVGPTERPHLTELQTLCHAERSEASAFIARQEHILRFAQDDSGDALTAGGIRRQPAAGWAS